MIITSISVPVITFIIGIFIHGIRYLGFEYYIHVYKKAQENKKRTLKESKNYKYPGLWQRLIFYLFRNGTVVEECMDNVKKKYKIKKTKEHLLSKRILKKQYRQNYEWIQNSKNPSTNIWIYANKIDHIQPENKIYRSYYMSEIFQCWDTSFLIIAVILFVLIFVNLFLNHFGGFNFSTKIPSVFFIPLFVIHKICKSLGKSFANRFLFAIQTSLNSIGQGCFSE